MANLMASEKYVAFRMATTVETAYMRGSKMLRMRQWGLLVLATLIASVAHAAPEFKVDGRRVEVETKRYRAVVDGLAVVSIENRLTD